MARLSRSRWLRLSLLALCAFGAWHTWKPLPAGLSAAGPWRSIEGDRIRLWVDRTWTDNRGERHAEHRIFDALLAAIARARHTVVLDVFLYNALGGALPPAEVGGRPLSRELTDALLAWRAADSTRLAVVITDPINSTYGAGAAEHLTELERAGVRVIETDLDRLRDSNPLYSAPWRALVRWWEDVGSVPGWLPHPLGAEGERVPLRPWLRLLNFKANHRKVLVCDDGAGDWTAIVASANPHDASSAHSNVAMEVTGAVALDVLDGELAVARFSGAELPTVRERQSRTVDSGPIQVQYVTEAAIESALVSALDRAGPRDEVGLAMFYLSDRDVVEALLGAAARGADVRVVLDPNRDAFGRTKDGVPNRQVAAELQTRSRNKITVRWYATQGEQFHSKLLYVRSSSELWFTLGSANFTRRNLADLNLEANLAVRAPLDSALSAQVLDEFEWLWRGDGAGWAPTVPFAAYADRSRLRRLRYFVMEYTGLSTF